ncbi:MAG: hypothetical protein E7643_08920 [Ruminococcaceae bacterium]|nr:hypothetical protein [Oscillospiraceae bacterium]
MTLYEKIQELCKKNGINVTIMCRECGASRGALGDLKAGRKQYLSTDTLKKIADYFSVSIDYLLGNGGTLSLPSNVRPISTKRFPMLGEISCGTPIFATENHETYVDASAEIQADFCLTAKGDSMIGARIHDGDVVFIKSMPMVENGQIAAVIIDDEATLKRWYYYPEKAKLVLTPENPAFEPLVYVNDELDNVHCLGLAVSFMSKL